MSFKKILVLSAAILISCSANAVFSPTVSVLPYSCKKEEKNWCGCFFRYMSNACDLAHGGDLCKDEAKLRALLQQEIQDLGIETVCTMSPIDGLSTQECAEVTTHYLQTCTIPSTR